MRVAGGKREKMRASILIGLDCGTIFLQFMKHL